MDPERTDGGPDLEPELEPIYANRFTDQDARAKDATWLEITRYLQRFVAAGPTLDVACDLGYFIRHIVSEEKWATDLRDLAGVLPSPIRFVQADGLRLGEVLPGAHFGTVFMSNYLEHLPSTNAVIQQLGVARDLLRPGGRVIILQPNIRLVGAAYWDFIDHKVALTERSLVEAAEAKGFRTIKLIVRFLPYTTKSRLPQRPELVRAYLRIPPLWRLFGGQTLYVGERP